MQQKKSFILLEVVVATLLFSVCIFPFLKSPFQSLKNQIDLLGKMQLQKVANETLSSYLVKFYQGKIPKETLDITKNIHYLPVKKIDVPLLHGGKLTYEEIIQIKHLTHRKGPDGTIFTLTQLQVTYKKRGKEVFSDSIRFIAQKNN